MTAPYLQASAIEVSFGGLRALQDCSFTIAQGRITCLVGPNGAGKTTIFNAITGFLKPDSGSVTFKGRALDGLKPQDIVALGIARTFQNLRLFRDLSALDNVRLGAHRHLRGSAIAAALRLPAHHRDEADAEAAARDALAVVGLTGSAQRAAGHLPYGHQRRLEIARALASRPRLLLLDEPAAGMHGGEADALEDLIRRIRDRGITIILIEHHMRLVMRLAERIVVLHHGAKLAEGTPAEIRADPQVITAYLGQGGADA